MMDKVAVVVRMWWCVCDGGACVMVSWWGIEYSCNPPLLRFGCGGVRLKAM